MATLTSSGPTLMDLTRRLDPSGRIATIAELLHQTNDVLSYLPWVEGNLPTGHRSTVRTGLPTPTWRKLYGGVTPTKSTTAQVTDTCGMLEAYAEVDKALADLNGNTAAFRLSEERAHIEGMNQEFMSTFFYGNEGTEPEAFTGLVPRYNSSTAENAINRLDGGSDTDSVNTSVWLVVFGPNTIHCIYPKGSTGGLQMNDKGQVTVENASERLEGSSSAFGGRYEAYRTHYKWDCGLVVRDWRYAVRISDIEVAQVTSTGSGTSQDTNLTDLMAQAIELVPSLGMGQPVFMMNRKMKSALRRQIATKVASSTLTMDQVGGKTVMTFDGIPVVRCDAIINTETNVV